MEGPKLAALSRLFSSATVRELAVKGKSGLFARLAREADILPPMKAGVLVKDAFEAAFAVLRQKGLRDEYVYKAALTHRVLLGRHSLRTACMLSEFRVGSCKADIAILNGTTTVYEIKSERDSLSRLEKQIDNYRKVFASVFVICGENHVRSICDDVPRDIGVMQLDRRGYLSTVREAVDSPGRICPATVFDALRTNEAEDVLRHCAVAIPDVPNTRKREELRLRFEKLRPLAVHQGMLRVLKISRDLQSLESLVAELPSSLQAAALSVPLRKRDHENLVTAVNTPLRVAMSWH